MNSIGKTIQCLRKAKGVTQEKMAQQIGVSFQTISKWENDVTMPDILLLPVIADYFGVSIDELFQYKWNVMTGREKLVGFMLKNGIINLNVPDFAAGKKLDYYVNTERFTTNMQLNAIGEEFAECLMENHVTFDAVVDWPTMASALLPPQPWRCKTNMAAPPTSAATVRNPTAAAEPSAATRRKMATGL